MAEFIEELYTNDWEVETPEGWRSFDGIGKTIPYQIYELHFDNGVSILCADTHIFISDDKEIYCKDLKIGDTVSCKEGYTKVSNIIIHDEYQNMYDLINVDGSIYYTNGILSHNSTIAAIYLLWYAIFNSDKLIGVVSNNEKGAIDILNRIKVIYEELPMFLKPGIEEYNKKAITFENKTTIMASATSKDSFRGRTANIIFCDELAFVDPQWKADEFFTSNWPTISASKKSKFIIVSTPKGIGNLFYTIFTEAEKGLNTFKHYRADWTAHPDRDEKWAEEQRKNLGTKRFNQEFGIEFLGSDSTVINESTLKELSSMGMVDPVSIEANGKFKIYEKPEEGGMYVMGCLPVNETVLTDKGIKKVQDVNPHDKLIDIDGNLTDIKNIQIYKDIDDKIYDVTVYGQFRSTKFTSEHPIYCSHNPKLKRKNGERYRDFNFEYDKVENLKEGDWVRYPNIYKKNTLNYTDINKYWKYSNTTRKDFRMKSPLLDKDFWWFVGIWLGDGWVENRNNLYSIHTCHNSETEKHFIDKINKIFKKYNRKLSIRNKGSVTSTQFNSKELYQFLVDNFGKGAKNKYISEWVKYIPDEFKYQLIKGYIDSDGCIYKNKNYTINIVSISLKLLEDIQDILFSLGYLPSISRLRKPSISILCGRECNIKETYQLCISNYDSILLADILNYNTVGFKSKRTRNKRYQYFSEDKKYIYIKIRKIEISKYKGDVYNFETGSHSFISRGIPTHNCDCAKGTGEHSSTIQVLKIESIKPIKLKQVAVFEDNKTDTYKFADIINRTSYYYNNAHIMVENNGEGSAVISQLWWEYENPNLVNEGSKTTKLGIRATSITKSKAVLLMKKLIEEGSLELVDYDTILQLLTFIDKNGIFTGNGNPDDLVSGLYWAPFIFTMDILEETMTFSKPHLNEDDGWGFLSDCENMEEDWSWLTQ